MSRLPAQKNLASPEDSDKLELCKLALEGNLLNKTDLGTPRAKNLLGVDITQMQMKNYLEKQNARKKNGKNQKNRAYKTCQRILKTRLHYDRTFSNMFIKKL